MVDEEKQINHTVDQQENQTPEVQPEMTSEATTETMNANDEGNAVNAQVAEESANQSTDVASDQSNAATPTAETDLQQQAAEMTQQLEALKTQLDERNSQYMRIAADFDNFRRRTQKEKEDLEQQIKRSTIIEILSVVDNFERARSQLKPQTEAEMSMHKSYQSIYKQLVDSLKRLGVAAMRPEGKEFDPNLHEAVLRQPTSESPEGTIIEELVRGYFLGDQVLRHAMVKVAAAPEELAATSEENQPRPADS